MYDPMQGGAWQGTDEQLAEYLRQVFGAPSSAEQAQWDAYMNPTAAVQKQMLDDYNRRRSAMGATGFQGYDGSKMTAPQYQAQPGAPVLPARGQMPTVASPGPIASAPGTSPSFSTTTGLLGNWRSPWGRY